jgi:hypothetical protein
MITLVSAGDLILTLSNGTTSTVLQVLVQGQVKPNFSQESLFVVWVPSVLDKKENLFTGVLNDLNEQFI